MKVEEMIDCPHTVRCLNRAGIETMEQLSACTVEDLLQIRGVGKVIANDVYRAIQAYRGKEKNSKFAQKNVPSSRDPVGFCRGRAHAPARRFQE